ncbi:hypothetical protein QBE53_06015 [Vallitaleaceae bacterium 9-2]
MINKEQFNQIAEDAESRGLYPCGYRRVCWERACPCDAGMKEFSEKIYSSLQQESERMVREECN